MGKKTVRVGSSLSPYLFDMILGVMGRVIIKQLHHWCMLLAGDIVLCST